MVQPKSRRYEKNSHIAKAVDKATAEEFNVDKRSIVWMDALTASVCRRSCFWGPVAGVPIAGCLGDQHAVMLVQACCKGEAKSTFSNNLLMQIQADLSGNSVVRPADIETTARRAAFVAGLAVGVCKEDFISDSGD